MHRYDVLIVGAGQAVPYTAVPWFWSNQYDLRLQTIGPSMGYDQCVVRGLPSERRYSVVYMRQGRVIALDCMNAPRDFAQGRALVLNRVGAPVEQLADVTMPLKALAPVASAPESA